MGRQPAPSGGVVRGWGAVVVVRGLGARINGRPAAPGGTGPSGVAEQPTQALAQAQTPARPPAPAGLFRLVGKEPTRPCEIRILHEESGIAEGDVEKYVPLTFKNENWRRTLICVLRTPSGTGAPVPGHSKGTGPVLRGTISFKDFKKDKKELRV